MGRNQARILSLLDEFEPVGVCDQDVAQATEVAAATGAEAYTDLDRMLETEKPDTATVCTPNASHAALTIAAARAGVRGVYCEKPMATSMADARAMVDACRESGAALVVNHQRRLRADLVRARQLIEEGALGQLRLVRGQCAGDVLTDGTHLLDSILFLTGEPAIEWVLAQIHRELSPEAPSEPKRTGFRYGHPVETGAIAVLQLETGVRVELACGDMIEPMRAYQDYEVVGTTGRLWRVGDSIDPNLFIQDARGGSWRASDAEWPYRPVPADDGQGEWRPVDVARDGPPNAIAAGYQRFARMIREGVDHPMSGDRALRSFEAVMAIYESARLHRRLDLPLEQERFPLELMIEQGLI
jgi:predicted dehydrogenase